MLQDGGRESLSLHRAAAAIAAQGPVTAPPTGVREYDEALATFAATSQALRTRVRDREMS
jgi:hypothetical protein